MQAVAQRLSAAGIPIEEFPQTVPNLTAMGQNLFELITGRNLKHYPDAGIRLAVGRAVAIETSRGWRISKEKASHKIDVVVAMAMACHAAVADQNRGGRVIISPEMLGRLAMMKPSRSLDGIAHRSSAMRMMMLAAAGRTSVTIGDGAGGADE